MSKEEVCKRAYDPFTEAEALGFMGFGVGASLSENPYPSSSEEHKEWESGWKQNWRDQVKAARKEGDQT